MESATASTLPSSVRAPSKIRLKNQFGKSGFTRVLFVLRFAIPILLSFIREERRFLFFGRSRVLRESQHRKRAEDIRYAMERLGAVFVKIGQAISARADLLPTAYVEELSKLQDKVEPLPLAYIRHILESEYNRPPEVVFDYVYDEILASASIGQVHRAVYKGKQVVIKIRRPGIAKQLSTDFKVAKFILRWTTKHFGFWQTALFESVANEVSTVMFEEIDYIHERRNAEEIRLSLADVKNVVIPAVIPELCTTRIIALEYFAGTKVSNVDELRKRGIDPEQLMLQLVTLYAHMILINGVYQADPHPGNLFVHADGRIILLDFGIVRRLSAKTRANLVDLIVAGMKHDIDRVVDLIYEIGLVKPAANADVVRDVGLKVVDLHFQGLDTASRLEAITDTIIKSLKESPIQLPGDLVYIFRTFSLLEGLGTRFRPGWNMFADGGPAIRPVLQSYLIESKGFYEAIKDYLVISYKKLFG